MKMQQQFTVAGVLRTQATKRPSAIMFVDGDIERTWNEQYLVAGRVAQALAASGIGPGDRVAFLDRNGVAYFDLLFGAALLGAVLVPVNWRLAPVEMAAVIADSTAQILVVDPEFLGGLLALGGALGQVTQFVVLGQEDDLPRIALLPTPKGGPPLGPGWPEERPLIQAISGEPTRSPCSSTPRARRGYPKA